MKIPFTNDSDKVMYVGPYAIPPGDTREVERSYLDSHSVPDTAVMNDAPQSIVLVLIAGSFSDLLAHLPALANEDLEALNEAEEAGAAREQVLAAIAEERLKRSSKKTELVGPEDLLKLTVKEIVGVLPLMTKQELLDLEALEAAGGAPRKSLMDALAKAVSDLGEA